MSCTSDGLALDTEGSQQAADHCEKAARRLGQDSAVAPCGPLLSLAQCPVPWPAWDRERWECQMPLPVLDSQAGQRVPGEMVLPPLHQCPHTPQA